MPAYIISTSYTPYLRALCELAGFPFEHVRCTQLSLDAWHMPDTASTSDLATFKTAWSEWKLGMTEQAAKDFKRVLDKAVDSAEESAKSAIEQVQGGGDAHDREAHVGRRRELPRSLSQEYRSEQNPDIIHGWGECRGQEVVEAVEDAHQQRRARPAVRHDEDRRRGAGSRCGRDGRAPCAAGRAAGDCFWPERSGSRSGCGDLAPAYALGPRGRTLVPGVEVYAYACHPAVRRWGRAWPSRRPRR